MMVNLRWKKSAVNEAFTIEIFGIQALVYKRRTTFNDHGAWVVNCFGLHMKDRHLSSMSEDKAKEEALMILGEEAALRIKLLIQFKREITGSL